MTRRPAIRSHHTPAGMPPQLPTTPTKAWVSAVVTLAGLVGLHLTSGQAQAVVMVAWVVLAWYGVWRTRNRPRLPNRGKGVSGFLS